jgi:hypothetical protein
MPRLSPAKLATRLAFDARVVLGLRSPYLTAVHGYVSYEALQAGGVATVEDGEAGRVVIYTVRYDLPILIGPGPTTPFCIVRFDLTAGGNYPYSTPTAYVTSRPLPWNAHVHPTSGSVCLGEGWQQTQGNQLFAHIIIHVMRLLNHDEPDREPTYGGWNAAAMQYWREKLGRRPLHPGLIYPVLPEEETHGVVARPAFKARGVVEPALPAATGFRAIGAVVDASAQGGFRAVQAPQGGFRPVGGGRS